MGIGCVHMESSGDTHKEIRVDQLNRCLEILGNSYGQNGILMGDTNFGEGEEYDEVIEKEGFEDIYKRQYQEERIKNPDIEEEWTMSKNAKFEKGWRPDKILAKKD